MRTNYFKAVVKAAVSTACILIFGVAAFGQAQQVNLTAGPAGVTLPDGNGVPMWGYSCGAAVATNATPISCLPLSGPLSAAASGKLGAVAVVSGGAGYTAPPAVTISAPTGTFTNPFTGVAVTGVAATATATIANGQVVGITITSPGAGYTSAPTVTITPAAGDTTGTGATATAGPAWSPVVITVPTGVTGGLQINLTNNIYSPLLTTSTGTSPVNPIPTSLVIIGQVGGGLGTGATYAASPDHSNAQANVTWPIANTGAAAMPPNQGPRVQSLATESAASLAGSTTATPTALTWTNLRPGTYLLESGTHPSIQVPMGLYGILVVTAAPTATAAGTAYGTAGTATAVSYGAEAPLEFSEIDPVQNRAVNAAVNTAGFSETANFLRLPMTVVGNVGVINGGSGYSSSPSVTITAAPGDTGTGATAVATVTNGVITSITVTNAGSGYGATPSVAIADATGTGAVAGAALGANSIAYCGGTVATGAPVGATGGPAACYPPAVNYTPFYFLINGVAFDKTNAAASLFAVSQGANTGSAAGTVLVRMVNAGSRMHVPSIVGSFTQGFNLGGGTALTTVPGFSLVAEDGNVVPQFAAAPRVQTDVFMAAGKTFDVMINVPLPVNGGTVPPSLAVYDRELSLSGNSSTRDAGMLAYISVNGATLPVAQGSGVFAAAMANQDAYNSVVAGQTLTVSDVSKGVIANDVSVYGVHLITPPANGTVALNANGTFTYTPNAGWSGDSFVYAANGATACQAAGTGGIFTGGACATVTLGLSSITATNKITCAPQTFNAKTAAYLAIKTPGLLLGCKDGANLPLTVVPSPVALTVGSGAVLLDSNGGFNATNTGAAGSPITFTFTVRNSQGTTGSGSATVAFPLPSNLQVTVLDGADKKTVISDYRWIIEEDKTFFVDPNCTTNNSTTGANGTANACPQATATTVPPTFGVNFHTSHMEYIAQGCTGGLNDRSCEEGQTVQGVPAACDLGNGKCDTSRTQQTAVSPGAVYLDPGCGWGTTANPAPANCGAIKAPYPKRYYISILPGDAANPFASGFAGAPDCSPAGVAAGNCGHGMGGSPITWNPITSSWNPVTILTQPSPYPPAKLSVQVFEDDFPLNGEQDAGGGVDVLATNEPGLGGFEIILWDDMGNSGDVTGQLTHDMFNQPLSNSLAGTIDPATGLDACPISPEITANIAGTGNVGTNGAGTFTPQGTQLGITGRIVTCPRYEADGTTVSPLVGQAVVANMMPGRYSVQAYPAADRIARGEEWLQTNTLDGQHAHDSFLRIGEPNYFQEYGPAGFHVSIGFANPAIINSRYAGVCGGTDLNLTAFNCTNTVTGKVTAERMSRIPDERLYSSGSRDAFYWTQCFVSLGDPDGMDFMFAKCDANGNFRFTGVPAGDWRLSVFDQWNDQLMDGLSTPVGVGPLRCANATANNTAGCNNLSVNLGDVAVQQWQANVYTRTFVDDNKDGIYQSDEIGIPLINVTVRYRDGSRANFLGTDFTGVANFNETFPLFNWYVVETDPTRYKTTGIHVVYDAGGPADGTTCGGAFPACGPAGTPYANLANTKDPYPLPTDLSVPGAIYCANATCSGQSISSGAGVPSTGNPTTSSTGRIDPPWVAAEGWQGFSGQNNFIEFGKTPYASCPPACVTTSTNTVSDTWAENGGIQGHVVYASTRPFDDPSNNVQQPWMPLVPRVTMNLYQEGFASDGVTPTLTLVDTTQTSSFDDWAQGFRSDGRPNMNCPGQGTASGGANPDLFFYTLFNQPSFLDLYNSWYNGGTQHTIPYNSQFKCYDGMHNWNQLQPAPYDGMYSFPSMLGVNPTTAANAGKLNTSLAGGVGTGATFTAAPMGGTNCIICVPNPDATDPWRHGTPMLPPGKYVVEVVLPPGYELVKEEDKNILIGDNFIAPVAQEFGGLGNIFIIPDQASVASLYDPSGSGYNANNTQNPTQSFGSIQNNQIVPGFAPEPVWPCVGELRIVPDYMSIFPQAFEVAAFAGATRNLCDRKEVTLGNQSASIAKFYLYTSTHIASKYSGGITDDFTSEFDPFAPVFGEKFAPPNMPVSVKDWAGNEISRVYSDHWGQFDGLTYSTWEVNPPNPTGYAPTMMVACMNDKGPVLDTRQTIVDSTGTTVTNPTFGQMVTDPLFNPAYSQFCYELPFMPGQTQYLDTPVVPTSAFVGAGYNNPDCNYPAATPAISSVVGSDGVAGPWVRAAGSTLTITALGDQVVNNYGYSGPSATAAPFNQKTVTRHYGFGGSGTVSIGGVDATAGSSWSDSQIVVTVPRGVPACAVQQQAQYGGSAAQCGELVITAAGGQRSIDTITVTIGGKQPTVLSAGQTIQSAIDAAKPGDMIIVPAGTYKELLLMWKPVRLQGVGAASSIIDANTHPAGTLKIDPWRREVNCLFGLALNGQPSTGNVTVSNGSVVPGTGGTNPYDSSGTFTCPWAAVDPTTFSGGPNYPSMVVDRIPLEGILGWDATVNGNLAEQLQEPTLMGAYEGAAVTVLAKGVNIPSGSVDVFGSGAEAAFPTGSTPLTGLVSPSGASVTGDPNPLCVGGAGGANQFPSNFMCNPSSIDGLGITDASQGGGGIFVHAWAHNLQVANNRVFNNAGTLSGGISIGQGESPEAYLNGTANDSDPGSCFTPVLGQTTNASFPLNTQLPYCINLSVNVHNNAITNNSSTGDELFSGTPAGAGGVSICTGADFYKFNFNWICGNLSTGDGGGVGHLGFSWNGDVEHNAFLFNQSTNPSIQTNGGGLIVMGAAPDATITINGITPECGSVTDIDCAPGLSDGTGPGLVINGNLFEGNGAEAGSGGGVRFQAVNGAEIARFPNPTAAQTGFAGGNCGSQYTSAGALNCLWYVVSVTNNIIDNNVAGWDGGGVSLEDALVVNLVNNTISSNDSTASSGVLFNTLGAPLASSQAPAPICQTTSGGTASCPQPAGLVTVHNSPQLTSSLTGPPVVAITCPAGHFQPTTPAINGTCRNFSYPLLQNNILWENRSFQIAVGGRGTGTQNQQNVVTLHNAAFGGGVGSVASSQLFSGACPSAASYWDIGVRGDTGPANHGSGATLHPTYSVLTSFAGYQANGGNNIQSNPLVASQYCNGSRVPPENGGLGYNVPAGISDAVVPNPVFNLTPTATVDEGNNWINISWGPLSMLNPVTSTVLGNYALMSDSPAVDYVPVAQAHPATDFFGNQRPDPANPNAFDVGAVEFQGAGSTGSGPTLTSISPNTGARGSTNFVVTLTGTNLTGTTAVNGFGGGITVNQFSVVSSTSVEVSINIASGAAPNARNVSVVTPFGTSNTVTFTVTAATVTISAPSPVLTTTTPNTSTKTGTITVSNAAAATGPLTLTAAPQVVKTAGAAASAFNITGGTCASGTVVNPGGSCTVIVQYVPAGTATATAHLSLANTGAASNPLLGPNFNAN